MAEELPARRPGPRLTGPGGGETVGGYRLESRIGAGGMAVVWRARDEKLDRVVALKVLMPALTLDEEFRERFIRESRAASTVDHPNIIPVYAAGEDQGALYLAMRHVSGGDLHSVVEREGPLPPARVTALLVPVASAIDAAHAAGIVHRDIKPANILIDAAPGRPDHPYLSDFGLAKRDTSASLTIAGEFVGTPGFAAPEQIKGQPAGPASDQYALACVVFTLLTAVLPFEHRSAEAALWAQMSQPPPRVTQRRPDLSPAVDDVIARGLALEPAGRYPNCAGFVDALSQALDGRAPAASAAALPAAPGSPRNRPTASPSVKALPSEVPAPAPASSVSRPRRRGRNLVLAAAVAVAVAAGAVVIAHQVSRAPAAAPAKPEAAKPGAPTVTLSGPAAPSLAIAFGAAGTLEDVGPDHTARTYDIGSGRLRASFPVPSQYAAGNRGDVQFSLSGEDFAVPVGPCSGFAATPCSYQVYDVTKQRQVGTVPAGSLAADGAGDFALAVVNRDAVGDAVGIQNLRVGDTIATLTEPDERVVESVAISPDARTAATASDTAGGTHRIQLWNVASQTVTATLTVPRGMGARWTTATQAGAPMALAGTSLVISDGLTTRLYRLPSTAHLAAEVSGSLLALSPDGTLFATTDPASADTVDVWNTVTGKKIAALVVPEAQPSMARAVFSADSQYFAVNCASGRTYVWKSPRP